jgi:membrane carboxypeptidase/penicillin-binding protein PbpC
MNRGIPAASTIYREASDGKLKAAMRASLKASPQMPEREPARTRKPAETCV